MTFVPNIFICKGK